MFSISPVIEMLLINRLSVLSVTRNFKSLNNLIG